MYLEVKCTGEAPLTRSQGIQTNNKDKQVLHFIYDPPVNFLRLWITSDHSSLHMESFIEWSSCGYICELLITLMYICLVSHPVCYRNTSPIRYRPIRWITPLRLKKVSLIRQPAPSSSAFPLLRIATVKAWYFPLLFIQWPKFNTYLISRYSLKCWPVCFTYKAGAL